MKLILGLAAASLMLAAPALALAPAMYAAQCKDGSTWSGKLKLGACTGHKGVATWTAAATAVAPPSTPATTRPTLFKTTPKPIPSAKAVVPAAASGGGAGQVWVNTKTKVYHCSSDPYYGKTKQGQYMTEAAALAAGDHADHGKACH